MSQQELLDYIDGNKYTFGPRTIDVPVITLFPGMKVVSGGTVKEVIKYDKGARESACDRTHIHLVTMSDPNKPSQTSKVCYHIGAYVEIPNTRSSK